MDVPFLDLKAQQTRIEPELRRRLEAVLAHCQFILGPEVFELEQRLAEFCGATHCVSVSSGTDALQIALMADGVGPGDAVFLPAFTYTATAEVPLLLGATPVFVDVDARTFQIDPLHLADRIAAVRAGKKLRPRALIGVDLFGQPADWSALHSVAQDAGIFALDDCAQSFGAALHGEMLGHAADATAVSFFPSKPLGGYGDGGALFTESAERAALYRSLRTHGEGTTRYEVLRTGMNGRLDTLQAAVLLAKLSVFADELAARERIARTYDSRLGNAVQIPARVPDSTSAWAIYAILLPDAAARTRMQAALKAAGVPSAIYYPRPLHHQPAYAATHDATPLPVAENLATRILALPIHPDLSDADIDRVCTAGAGGMSDAAAKLRNRYLNLLEAALTGTLHGDAPIDPWSGGVYDANTRLLGRDWPSLAQTMIGSARLRNLRQACETVLLNDVPGDFIETGVWRGGACIFMRGLLDAYGDPHRRVFVADSFAGLPRPEPERYAADAGDAHHTFQQLAISRHEVESNFRRYGLLDERVVFLQGWFEDTLPAAPIERLAILRLDGDMYASTMQALNALYSKVARGGIVIIDDYVLKPCAQAVDEFRAAHGIMAPLLPIDGIGVWWTVDHDPGFSAGSGASR